MEIVECVFVFEVWQLENITRHDLAANEIDRIIDMYGHEYRVILQEQAELAEIKVYVGNLIMSSYHVDIGVVFPVSVF